ncbi:MAG: hypothetical protein WBA45_01810 [Microthrixaceae bacterium]
MSVDELIRDQLEALVEPLDDPGAIVAAIEGRHRGAHRWRRGWPMLASAAAIVVLGAVGVAIWLGGEPDRQVVAGPGTTATSVPNTEPADSSQSYPSAGCDGVELPDLTAVMPDGFTGPLAGLGGGAGSGPPCARHWKGRDRGIHVSQLPGSSPFGLVPDGQEGLFRWGPIHEGFGIEYAGEVPWNVAAYGLDEASTDHLLQALIASDDAANIAASSTPQNGLPECVRSDGFEPLPLPGTEREALSAPDPERLRDAVWDRAALAVPQLASDPDIEPVLDGCAVLSAAGGGAYIGIAGSEATGYVLTELRYPSASDDVSIGVRIQGDQVEASVPAGCGECVAELSASYGGEVAKATAPAAAESVTVTVARSTGDPGALVLTLRDDTGDVVRVDGIQVPPGDFAAG